MKNLADFGIWGFVAGTGYNSDMAKEYPLNHEAWSNDIAIELGKRDSLTFHYVQVEGQWTVTIAHNGEEAMTGGPVLKVSKYLDGERILVKCGDGLASEGIGHRRDFQFESGSLATVSAFRPTSRFGVMEIDERGIVSRFRDEPDLGSWISTGQFMMEPAALVYLGQNPTLEQEIGIQWAPWVLR